MYKKNKNVTIATITWDTMAEFSHFSHPTYIFLDMNKTYNYMPPLHSIPFSFLVILCIVSLYCSRCLLKHICIMRFFSTVPRIFYITVYFTFSVDELRWLFLPLTCFPFFLEHRNGLKAVDLRARCHSAHFICLTMRYLKCVIM